MQNFWYMFAAYTIVWVFLGAYAVYLSRIHRELREDLRELRARVERASTRKRGA